MRLASIHIVVTLKFRNFIIFLVFVGCDEKVFVSKDTTANKFADINFGQTLQITRIDNTIAALSRDITYNNDTDQVYVTLGKKQIGFSKINLFGSNLQKFIQIPGGK